MADLVTERLAFAHEGLVEMDGDGDTAALGAAVTLELCGHWDHEPPCPLAPHFVAVTPEGDRQRVRVLFSTEAERETDVRGAIERALGSGHLVGPDGTSTTWKLLAAEAVDVRPDELAHADRLRIS